MFKRYSIIISLILTHVSFIYPNPGLSIVEDEMNKSRIIISGNSSIIISSQNNKTNVLTSKIETIAGGKLTRIVAPDNNSEGLKNEFAIEKAYPNPFNPTTTIRYSISTTIPVDVVIYDMKGRLVSDYKIKDNAPGSYEFTWQGNDSHGQQVSTGMYLVTMRAGEHLQKQKVTFLK